MAKTAQQVPAIYDCMRSVVVNINFSDICKCLKTAKFHGIVTNLQLTINYLELHVYLMSKLHVVAVPQSYPYDPGIFGQKARYFAIPAGQAQLQHQSLWFNTLTLLFLLNYTCIEYRTVLYLQPKRSCFLIEVSLSKPYTCQTASPVMYICM